MKTSRTKHWRQAFTLVEVFIVILVVVVVGLALLLPALARAKARSVHWYCQNNLKMIGIAFRVWEGDYNNLYPMSALTNADGTMKFADATNAWRYFQVMADQINNPRILICPQDRKRLPATNFTDNFGGANISYFIGLDAAELSPTRLLSGDRNITNGAKPRGGILDLTANQTAGWTPERHQGNGNLLFSDGSAQSYDAKQLNAALAKTGLTTNRLALP